MRRVAEVEAATRARRVACWRQKVIPRSARVNLLSAIYVDKQRTTFDTTTSSLVNKVREVGPLLTPAGPRPDATRARTCHRFHRR